MATHLSFWVAYLVSQSPSLSACLQGDDSRDESFAQNRAERGLMEVPQNTVKVGLVAPVSCRSVFRIWRTNASRLVAGPGMGSVLVVSGVMALIPRPCQR